jgi:autotransporter strand-loop-strand O-heptosyltransferase
MADYYVEIWDENFLRETIRVKDFLKNKRVFISFDSAALGDNLAWMPYCLEFKKTYDCHVIVSTFKNFLFEKKCPELEFVDRGIVVNNIAAMFELGWFWDKDKEPEHPATIPLQKSATNILGLDYREIVTDIDFVPKERPIQDKYVVISTHSTAGLKYWTKEGWQDVINYLSQSGYKVFEISKEDSDFDNILPFVDKSLENTMNFIHHSEFFMGLSSGLSWLSWAMKKKVFMINQQRLNLKKLIY